MTEPAAAQREDFFAMAHAMARADFAARCLHPFLVVGDPSQAIRIAMEGRVVFGDDAGRLAFDPGDSLELPRPGEALTQIVGTWAVVKSERNPYRDRISVGRARTCDLVLPTRYVSKLHAHFLPHETGWELRDANSTNGTWRNGVRLDPGVRVPLLFGDMLRFGYIDAQFLDAIGYHDLAHRQRAR